MHTEHFWKGHTQKKRAWHGQRALWPKQRNDHIGAFAVCAFAEVNTAFGSQKLFWESGRLYQQDLQKWKGISSAVWRAHSVLKTVKDKWLTSTVNQVRNCSPRNKLALIKSVLFLFVFLFVLSGHRLSCTYTPVRTLTPSAAKVGYNKYIQVCGINILTNANCFVCIFFFTR